MSEHEQVEDAAPSSFELRSREILRASVDGIDMRVQSQLTRARHAALTAAARRRSWFFQVRVWTPAAGVTAAAILGAALWLGLPAANHGVTPIDNPLGLEDLDIVTASDEGSGDALEMLQNDLDFYDFADKAANAGPAA
jgi:hypothetical protein